jgi:hypothetical protein
MEAAMKIVHALALLVASTGPCMADPECNVPLNPALGRIAPTRAHFLNSGDGCPSAASRCVLRSYLVRDDVVLLGEKKGAWQCVLYPIEAESIYGWLPMTALQVLPDAPNPPLTAWVGHWVRDKDASIDIKLDGAKLSVDGNAIWQGRERYDIRDGEIDGEVRPKGDTLLIDKREPGSMTLMCIAILTLNRGELDVMDDGQCGGVNVSFNGGYERRRRPRR